jgi:hypothetical protein
MVAYLTEQSNVVAAYLFGSAARRQATHLSDVDIAVLLDAEIDTESSVEQQVDLMIALEKFASHEVQVTILNRAPPLLAYQVIRDGVLLYERDETERVAFEVNVMKVYFDLKPVFEFHRQALIKRIQEEGLGRQTGHSTGTLEAAKRLRERLTGTAER